MISVNHHSLRGLGVELVAHDPTGVDDGARVIMHRRSWADHFGPCFLPNKLVRGSELHRR